MIRRLVRNSRFLLFSALILALGLALSGMAPAHPFPGVVPLPNGFQPEGIASGRGSTFYVGSIPTGAIYRGDLRTGQGDLLVPASPGRMSIGLKYDGRTDLLYVAGGPTGKAFVYDAATGDSQAEVQLAAGPSFVNDEAVTNQAVYFTESFQPVLYRLPLEADGRLPAAPTAETIPLGGDFQFVPGNFNANGIVATPDGRWLVIVSSALGALYRVDPQTGVATQIDLGGGAVPAGDGLWLHGQTLYVVQNAFNQIAVVALAPDLASGVIERTISSADFRVPTTLTEFGEALYVVNARFDVTPTPDTEYEVVRVLRR